MASNRWIGVAALVVALPGGQVRAQVINRQVGVPPPSGPVVSPYLNLLRGNTPTLNYYGLVRPQLQAYAGIQSLQQQFLSAQNRQLPGVQVADDVLVTGHAAYFMNFGGYFQSLTGGLRPGGPQGVAGARPPAPAPGARLPAIRR